MPTQRRPLSTRYEYMIRDLSTKHLPDQIDLALVTMDLPNELVIALGIDGLIRFKLELIEYYEYVLSHLAEFN